MGHLSILEWMKEHYNQLSPFDLLPTTIPPKIVHLDTTHINSHYIKWAQLQMTDDSEIGLSNITGHYMHFFYIQVP